MCQAPPRAQYSHVGNVARLPGRRTEVVKQPLPNGGGGARPALPTLNGKEGWKAR